MARFGLCAVLAFGIVALASARMPLMPGPEVPDPAGNCGACLMGVRIVEDFLCDPAATEFLVDFVEKQICPAVGDSVKCHNLAEGLLPTMIQWFRASTTPAWLCSSVGVCGAAVLEIAPLNRPAIRVHDNSECAMCKMVVNHVKAAINDSQAMEKVKEVALEACAGLPKELSDSCTDFVNAYEPLMAEFVEDMDSDTVCGLLGVCAESAAAIAPPPLPASLMLMLAKSPMLHRPPPPPFLFMVLAKLGFPVPFPGHGGPGHMGGLNGGPMGGMMGGPAGPGNDACDYCKMAVIEAHSLVSNPTVQAEVLNYTKTVCDSFSTFADPCKAYVDLYAPLVFTLLEQYLVPDTLCSQTGMCPPHPEPGGMMVEEPPRTMCGWFGALLHRVGGFAAHLLPHHFEHGPDPKPEPRPLMPVE